MNAGGIRRFLGGRSTRPDRRGPVRQAPQWSAIAAVALERAIDVARGSSGKFAFIAAASADPQGQALRELSAELGRQLAHEHHRQVAAAVLAWHVDIVRRRAPGVDKRAALKCFFAAMQRATAGYRNVPTVVLPQVSQRRGLADLLPCPWPEDRRRDLDESEAVAELVAQWGPRPSVPTVFVPQRAAARIQDERGGEPDPAFIAGVVFTSRLPALTANPSDHYVSWDRWQWWSVGELALAMGVLMGDPQAPPPLWAALAPAGGLTPSQAGRALGNGVHGATARFMLRRLLQGGEAAGGGTWDAPGGVSYGSAYSGIDTVAAAMDDIFGEAGWTYEFAAESGEKLRKALHAAWGLRGLRWHRIHADVGELAGEVYVDVFVITPECVNFSGRNRTASLEKQAESLRETSVALEYVRRRRPRFVLVENVDEPSVVTPLSAVLGDMRALGYVVERVPFCPRVHAGETASRWRSVWLLVRGA